MEQTMKVLDAAYNRLQRWVSRELRTVNSCLSESSPLLRQGLSVLSERPTLFAECLDDISNVRQKVIAKDFVQALSEGSSGSRAIDVTSYDPMRYIGDILAWLHQSVASEKEVIDAMIGSSNRSRFTEELGGEGLDFQVIQNELVDRNFNLVAVPLRVLPLINKLCTNLQARIDQIIVSQEERIIAFKTAILIRFYHSLLTRVLETDASLLNSCKLYSSDTRYTLT